MSVANQQFDKAAIESIVREVLRRLQCVGNQNPIATAASNSNGHHDSHSFACDDKVIAMETLRGKLENIKTLRVKPKTIITPAARDELRDRKIEIAFDLGSSGSSNNSPTTILLGTTCNSTGNRLRDQLTANGTQIQLHVDKCARQLATKVGNKVSGAMPALIVTDQPYKAVCSANRNSNVRAVVIGDPNELRAAKAELNPNCVVIKTGNEGRFDLSYVLNQLT